MVNPIKKSQVDEIKSYIENHSDKYNKLVIFGKSITDSVNDDDFLEVAVQTVNPDDANDDNALYDIFCEIDDITDGKFELVIINCKNNTSDIINLVNNGEVIYE